MASILFRNATVIDGSGAPAHVGDVGVKDGKLTLRDFAPDEIVDAAGLCLAPGFIDAHSHGDLSAERDFTAYSKLSQGFTTQVSGQCGLSMFPANPAEAEDFTRFIENDTPYPTIPRDLAVLTSFARYRDYLERIPMRLNNASFVGHSALRLAVMGNSMEAPSPEQLAAMQRILRDAMEHGALGLSTGLVYAPGCYAKTDEVVSLCRVVAEMGGIYTTHIRNEADDEMDALNEAIHIARSSGARLNISHMKVCGVSNHGNSVKALELFSRTAAAGTPVTLDAYPYLAGSTSLAVAIPPRFRAGGPDALARLLADPAVCAEIREEMSRKSDYENSVRNCGGFDKVLVASCPIFRDAEGKYVGDYARERGMDPFDAYFDILRRNSGVAIAIYFSMCDEDLLRIAQYPTCMIGSDGLLCHPDEMGHPRAFGTAVRAIRHYVDEAGIFTLEEAIRRMTSLTAEQLGLAGKGRIAEGYDADLVLFDRASLADRATYLAPTLPCAGIRGVYVGGALAYDGEKLTQARAGKQLSAKRRS